MGGLAFAVSSAGPIYAFTAQWNSGGGPTSNRTLADVDCDIGGASFLNATDCATGFLSAPGSFSLALSYPAPDGTTTTASVVGAINGGLNISITTFTVTFGAALTKTTAASVSTVFNTSILQEQSLIVSRNIRRHIDLLTGFVPARDDGGAGAPTNGPAYTDQDARQPTNGVRPRSGAPAVGGRDFIRQAASTLRFESAGGDVYRWFGDSAFWRDDRLTDDDKRRQRDDPLSLWAYSDYVRLENTRDDLRFRGDIVTGGAGADIRPRDGLVVGAAVFYSNIAIDTAFNDGDHEEHAFTISPYIVYQPRPWLTLDGLFGYTRSAIEQTKDASGASRATGQTAANSLFGSTRVKTRYAFDTAPMTFSTSLVFTRGRRSVDPFVDDRGDENASGSANTTQIRLATEADYAFDLDTHARLAPFARGDLVFDLLDRTNDDRISGEVGGGLRIVHDRLALSAALEATTKVGARDFRAFAIHGVVSTRFNSPTLRGAVQPGLSFGYAAGGPTLGAALGFNAAGGGLAVSINAGLTRSSNAPAVGVTARGAIAF